MSRRSYGAPRVHAELRLGLGLRVGRKRVARLMRSAGVRGICHRRKRGLRPLPAPHEDLVRRKFTATGADRLWATDITEHPTSTGKVYCCAVVDAYSRMVVGWSIADHTRSELVIDALQMAIWRRRPGPGTICHAEGGSQYTSWIFGHRLREAGLLGSMGRVASSVDNTMIESFWSTSNANCSTPAPGPTPTCSPATPGPSASPRRRCRSATAASAPAATSAHTNPGTADDDAARQTPAESGSGSPSASRAPPPPAAPHAAAASGSAWRPTADAHDAAPRPRPPPTPTSATDSTPADETGPPAPPDPRSNSAGPSHAPTAGTHPRRQPPP